MGIRLGMEAVLHRNTATYAAPTWVDMPNCKDVTLNLEAGEADVTTRANAGWRAIVATLKEGSVEFELIWDTEDATFLALQSAFFNNTPIELAVMDGPIATSGSQGLRATCSVLNFSRSEPLEEAISASVTVKPTYSAHPPEWMVVP
jgi:hypothetical protein